MIDNILGNFSYYMKKTFPEYCEYKSNFNCSNELKNYYDKTRPDYVFIQLQQTGVLTKELAEYITNKSKIIIWNGDKRILYPEYMHDIGKYCHCVAHSNFEDVEYAKFNGFNSSFLQIGFNPLYFKKHNTNPVNDLIFIGNYNNGLFPLSDYRKEVIEEVQRSFNLSIYGCGFKNSKGSINNHTTECALYNRHKIGINISQFNSSRYTSDRLLRMMGSGIFVISHHYKDIEKDFNIGEHLVTYNDHNDLKDKISYYLNNTEERNQIALNGMNYVHSKFTFNDMAKNIKTIFEHENPNDLF